MTPDQRQSVKFLGATLFTCVLLAWLLYLKPSSSISPETMSISVQADHDLTHPRSSTATDGTRHRSSQSTMRPQPGTYPDHSPTTPQIALTVPGANELQSLLQELASRHILPHRIITKLNTVIVPNDFHLLASLRRRFPELSWENDAPIQRPSPPQLTAQTPGIPFRNNLLNWLGIDTRATGRGKGVTIALLDQPLSDSVTTQQAAITQLDPFHLTGLPNDGHGNAVASLMVAQSPQLQGIVPEANLLSIPVLDAQGTGSIFTLAEAIILATDHGADIISLSLGTHTNSTVLQQAVGYATGHGTVIVAAAGNDAQDIPVYPAASNQVIAVTACDAASNIASFSNRGAYLDIAAPGLEIMADFGTTPTQPDTAQLGLFSGTSAATPCVAAVIAGILAENHELTPTQAAEIVQQSTVDNGKPGPDNHYGKGVLNAQVAQHWNDETFTDAAVAGHFLDLDHATGNSTPLTVSAQNTGNTTLSTMTITLTANGNETQKTFTDVQPGQTMSLTVDIPNTQREHITVSSQVTTDADEANTQNNRKTSHISVRPAIPK